MKNNALVQNRADSFLRMIRRSQRGRLKIYLGYGAGVGKTYQMLLEGHQLKAEGIDIVIGLVETHGRADTAKLIEGLEVIPRHCEEYRGVNLEEMDAQAVLARKPQVALIDELAHTNAPGSRNTKRYQDVQDILAAGIHVITTLNIQHLESLYDTVEKQVRIRVKERLPDTVIAEADEIVNVDLSPEDLQKRLKEGKIYPSDRIQNALTNFFRGSNLETLRELTLRELAAHIDLHRREQFREEDTATPDQVMVCLSSRGPNSEMLLRYASRLAGRLNRNWYAVYVQTSSEAPTVVDIQTQQILSSTLTLAKQLGAMVFTYKGEDIANTILRFAVEYRVGHIVIGSPGPMPIWKRLIGRKNIVEDLIAKARGMTVVVLDTRKYEESIETKEPVPATGLSSEPLTIHSLHHPRLSDLLSSTRITIWDRPVSKNFAIRTLLELTDVGGIGDFDEILSAILKREQESSTFFNEGVAFPHIGLDVLEAPIISMGIAKQGISDVATAQPINLVFLILSPKGDPTLQVRLLALVSRAAQNRSLLNTILASENGPKALAEIHAWESIQIT